jgi:hypothetical protein
MEVDVNVGCDQNIITITGDGNPLPGVIVKVLKDGTKYEDTTNSKGEFKFTELDGKVDIYITANGKEYKSGGKCYRTPSKFSVTLKTSAECVVCGDGKKEPTEECEEDADCAENYTCENCKCVAKPKPSPEPKPPGCKSNDDCAVTEECSAGDCIPVPEGTCGIVENHEWFDYECCKDEDCVKKYNEEYICESNKCVLEEYDLQGKGGFAGDSSTVTATLDGDLLANTDVRVTKPDGSYEVMTTDDNGQIKVALLQAGDYKVDLLVNGTLKKSITVKALPKTPVEPSRPTFFDVLAQNSWVLLIILVVGIGAYMLLRKPRTVRKKPGRLK